MIAWKKVAKSHAIPFGRRLYVWRMILLGKRSKVLVRAAGLSAGHYKRLEGGARSPSVATLEKLADALELPLDALVGRGEPYFSRGRVEPPPGFPARLADLRVRAGLAATDLAVRAGLHASTVRRLEAGLRRPSFALAVRLARALGRPLDDLAGPTAARAEPVGTRARRRHIRVRGGAADYAI